MLREPYYPNTSANFVRNLIVHDPFQRTNNFDHSLNRIGWTLTRMGEPVKLIVAGAEFNPQTLMVCEVR